MAPKEGYENLAVELAHDMGALEERLLHQGKMQEVHGGMLVKIGEKIDGFAGHCAEHRAEVLDIVDHRISPIEDTTARVTRAVAPAEIVKAFRGNSLFKIVLALAAVIGASFAGWVGYTHNLADHNEDRVIRVEQALGPLKKLPAQMRVQERKIDRILNRLIPHGRVGGS
jgi:hypothetical protein